MLQYKWVLTAANHPESTWRDAAAAWMCSATAYDSSTPSLSLTRPRLTVVGAEWCCKLSKSICTMMQLRISSAPRQKSLKRAKQRPRGLQGTAHLGQSQADRGRAFCAQYGSSCHHPSSENKPVHVLVAKISGSDLEAEGTIFGRCSAPYMLAACFRSSTRSSIWPLFSFNIFICFAGVSNIQRMASKQCLLNIWLTHLLSLLTCRILVALVTSHWSGYGTCIMRQSAPSHVVGLSPKHRFPSYLNTALDVTVRLRVYLTGQ